MTIETTQDILEDLRSMARQCQAITGKLPTTVKELADYWYDLGHVLCALDPPKYDWPENILECKWLYQIAERSDADALLAQALIAPEKAIPGVYVRKRALDYGDAETAKMMIIRARRAE